MGHLDFSRVFNQKNSLVARYKSAECIDERGLTRTGAPADENILSRENVILEAVRKRLVEGSGANQILHVEMTRIELANRQDHAVQTTGRYDGGDPASIRKSRVENWLRFRDVIAQASGDIFHGNHQRFFSQADTLHLFKESPLFDEDVRCAVHHHFADGIIEQQMLDGP